MATMPMEHVSRAYEKGETKGFMKIVVDAGKRADTRRLDSRPRAATRSSTACST